MVDQTIFIQMRDTASMRDAGMRDSISHNTLLQHHVTTISRPVHVQQRLQPKLTAFMPCVKYKTGKNSPWSDWRKRPR